MFPFHRHIYRWESQVVTKTCFWWLVLAKPRLETAAQRGCDHPVPARPADSGSWSESPEVVPQPLMVFHGEVGGRVAEQQGPLAASEGKALRVLHSSRASPVPTPAP